MSTLDINITIILGVALFAASLLTTAQYGLLSPWYSHLTGIGLFTILASFTIITGMSVSQWFFPLNLHLAWVAYILTIAALVFMWALITREQIRGRRSRR